MENRTLDHNSSRAFQTVIVLMLVFVMASVFMGRIVRIDAEMERAAIEQVLSVVRSNMQVYAFVQLRHDKDNDLELMENTDPMQLLGTPPANYMGSIDVAGKLPVKSGYWYFDAARRELAYNILHAQLLRKIYPEGKLRFRVVLSYNDVDRNYKYNADQDELRGLKLVPVKPGKLELVTIKEWDDEHDD